VKRSSDDDYEVVVKIARWRMFEAYRINGFTVFSVIHFVYRDFAMTNIVAVAVLILPLNFFAGCIDSLNGLSGA
jgi:hypothetical protein